MHCRDEKPRQSSLAETFHVLRILYEVRSKVLLFSLMNDPAGLRRDVPSVEEKLPGGRGTLSGTEDASGRLISSTAPRSTRRATIFGR